MLKFGTGGWRAVIAEDFTKDNICKIIYGIAVLNGEYDSSLPIIIGYDNRFMSKNASQWICQELSNKYNISVEIFDESIPTPLLMHYVKNKNLNFGIMVTASHNPYYYNGLKIIVTDGKDAPVEITNKIQWCSENIDNHTLKYDGGQITTICAKEYFETYLDSISSILNFDTIKNYKGNFIFNAMNGSSISLFKYIVDKFNLKCDFYRDDIDETFRHDVPAPNKDTIKDFSELIKNENRKRKRNKYEFGIAFDGDGDRLGVIDRNGNYIDMNKLLCIFYLYLLKIKKMDGCIVKNCVTTSILESIAKDNGQKCINVPVGFKWITDAMIKNDAIIGGESSGGLTMRGHIWGKDSVFSALLLIELLSDTEVYIDECSELVDVMYGKMNFYENQIKYTPDNEINFKNFIKELQEKYKNYQIDTMDGTKIIDKNGEWLSLRFSGTEPIVRLMGEFYEENKNSELLSIYFEIKYNLENM